MKTKTRLKNKVNIITLGCAKNIVDSENIYTQLKGNNIDVAHESTEDDHSIVIINTCGFIDNAKQESIDTILQYAEAKENGLIEKLFVTGCLSERYRSELENEIPQVDAFFGTRELPQLLKKFKADYKHELVGERFLTTPNQYAYLKIAEGCDRPCSFCAIPLMRGKHISQPIDLLIQQAENFAKNGTKELILIAQDLTYYGLDIYKKRNLAELLERLSDIEGIEWIRLQYAFPTGFPMDILEVMNQSPKICKYLDMPLQHGSSKILQLMRRGINREKTEILIDSIRQKVPEIAIRTTMLIGYPQETDEDFEEMYRFVEKMKFERLGVFTYSHEENTHAYKQTDDVPEAIKRQRADELMALQELISLEHNQKQVDKILKVLFDRKEGDFFIGRTEFDSPEVDNEVLVPANNQYVGIGTFGNVKINKATEFDLFGDLV